MLELPPDTGAGRGEQQGMRWLRNWWRYADKGWVQYLGVMLLALLVIYAVALPLASKALALSTPVEHHFGDGVRCYTQGSAISCLVVRP
jgi:hypothetical protein